MQFIDGFLSKLEVAVYFYINKTIFFSICYAHFEPIQKLKFSLFLSSPCKFVLNNFKGLILNPSDNLNSSKSRNVIF